MFTHLFHSKSTEGRVVPFVLCGFDHQGQPLTHRTCLIKPAGVENKCRLWLVSLRVRRHATYKRLRFKLWNLYAALTWCSIWLYFRLDWEYEKNRPHVERMEMHVSVCVCVECVTVWRNTYVDAWVCVVWLLYGALSANIRSLERSPTSHAQRTSHHRHHSMMMIISQRHNPSISV